MGSSHCSIKAIWLPYLGLQDLRILDLDLDYSLYFSFVHFFLFGQCHSHAPNHLDFHDLSLVETQDEYHNNVLCHDPPYHNAHIVATYTRWT